LIPFVKGAAVVEIAGDDKDNAQNRNKTNATDCDAAAEWLYYCGFRIIFTHIDYYNTAFPKIKANLRKDNEFFFLLW
ncbi:MAG: hypothetical protein IJP90_00205, partial [Treponema sp.]|nr:hypothetical protein [Treponema sp.]